MFDQPTNPDTRYTVLNRHGEIECSGEALHEAAQTVLSYDGHGFEIRQNADGHHELWVTPFSKNSTLGSKAMVLSKFTSDAQTISNAELDIFEAVLLNSELWSGLRVVTDQQYADEIEEVKQESNNV